MTNNKFTRKMTALIVLFAMSYSVAQILKLQHQETSCAWIAISEAASKKGYSKATMRAINVAGVLHATMEGAIWGSAFGPWGSAIAGIGYGL